MMISKQTNKQRLKTFDLGKITLFYLVYTEGGFTIIESLVTILVVSILLAAIAPVIALSVATRVQSRRVELASQAARSYIDAVRTQKIPAPAPPATNTSLSVIPAPTTGSSFNCTVNSYCTSTTTSTTPPTNLYCIDFDGSGSCESSSVTDMVVQAFRPTVDPTGTTAPGKTGYALGVRVYRADAFKNNNTLSRNNVTGNNEKVTQNTFTAGADDRRKAPLVEMTADISDTVPTYNDLCARIPTPNSSVTKSCL
ncbi:prepilin-type N-terminal cleavage/methylation domain-containing protein [Nostocaceae cyanobacterium CENA357]|uniref:Prepilin-type N-terminal cleavage/methylation domain-containing protein n=1 Tax=Atlanticothrix silvestris CENA357 TaxID=1725252 RepID=A0A8J7HI01_9CYAN|nr:hormogonium polysaccharide secretion pseudopilin HpsB [Atlanticothrix silvestris]MBH8555073.1 prepilin-type N-terminal cleavage/methylation domain-containing protein [Atlanticothrix silvestris CENA357]